MKNKFLQQFATPFVINFLYLILIVLISNYLIISSNVIQLPHLLQIQQKLSITLKNGTTEKPNPAFLRRFYNIYLLENTLIIVYQYFTIIKHLISPDLYTNL